LCGKKTDGLVEGSGPNSEAEGGQNFKAADSALGYLSLKRESFTLPVDKFGSIFSVLQHRAVTSGLRYRTPCKLYF